MSLLRSPVFKTIGATLVGVALLGLCVAVVVKVFRGEGLSAYITAKGAVVPHVAALVLIALVAVTLVGVGMHRLWLLSEPARMRRVARKAATRSGQS
jgi:hypothetical protein